jgi:hypothetical protein
MGTILTGGYLHSILSSALHGTGRATRKAANNSAGTNATPAAQQPDSGQLSPFAQLVSTLQQLQQSNPVQYQQVTQQIATNLQSAAQTAQVGGNPTAGNQLSQLATDFGHASQNGQLPNVQDLARNIFGQFQAAASGSNGNSVSGSGSGGANQALGQLFSAFQSGGSTNGSLNPLAVIDNTLSAAGISISNS